MPRAAFHLKLFFLTHDDARAPAVAASEEGGKSVRRTTVDRPVDQVCGPGRPGLHSRRQDTSARLQWSLATGPQLVPRLRHDDLDAAQEAEKEARACLNPGWHIRVDRGAWRSVNLMPSTWKKVRERIGVARREGKGRRRGTTQTAQSDSPEPAVAHMLVTPSSPDDATRTIRACDDRRKTNTAATTSFQLQR